jgi:nucleotide-binding universal stress UspA family protein
MFKKILHPTDFSDVAFQAFEQAIVLARLYKADLEILHAVVLHEYDPKTVKQGVKLLNKAWEALKPELEIRMREMAKKTGMGGDACSPVLKHGFGAGDVIIQEALDTGAGLIVMGTHGHSPVRHFFLGSVAEKVVRYAPCPVMVLGRQDEMHGRFDNILLPVDFSEASHKAAEIAVNLAEINGATIHLLHVYQDIVPPKHYAYMERAFQWDPGLKQRGEEALVKFMAKHAPKIGQMISHLAEGRIARSIVDFSQSRPVDLIVMGTAGLTGVHHFMLGSTTEKVLRKASVPVLTVRAAPADVEI